MATTTAMALPDCPRHIAPPPTQHDLPFADLPVVDLAQAHTPDARARLRDALRTHGFLYAIHHGYSPAQRDRIFDIADIPFTAVPPEEHKIYAANIEKDGSYAGYKARGVWNVDRQNTVTDQIEQYSMHRNVYQRPHPEALRPFLPELNAFARHNHFNILHPLLRLIALSLELPEETLVDKHTFEGPSENAVRFLKYYRRTEEVEENSNHVWLKGHTDIGTLTILWSQPVGGLQILAPDGTWRWVRHMDNAVVVNTGDMMAFLTGGFYAPTIHRVVQPPDDQRAYDRLGVFYFAMADDDVPLVPLAQLAQSPVIASVGVARPWPDDEAPLAGAWRKARTISYGRVALTGGEKDTQEEVVGGIVVKHYN